MDPENVGELAIAAAICCALLFVFLFPFSPSDYLSVIEDLEDHTQKCEDVGLRSLIELLKVCLISGEAWMIKFIANIAVHSGLLGSRLVYFLMASIRQE